MFRTYEPAHDRLVAVKAYRLDLTPEQAHGLAAELQHVAEADLDHPSIVRVIGAGVEGTLAYSAHEYVAAESLDIALRHYAPAGLDMALPFITQLAGAIDFARAAGVGHGALHPRDIFVTPDEARATGFGVVQALESSGIRAPVRRPYTAPERVDGGPWDVTADVYSLGAIAFELLTGRRPVGAESGPLGSNAGPHADDIARVISRALSDEPAHRYPSALAFAAALEASSRGERTTAAIEEVQAVAEAGMAGGAISAGEPPERGRRELTVEPEAEDVAAERESDLADIQLRESEPSPGETIEERAVAQPPLPEPTPLEGPPAAPPLTAFPEEPPEREDLLHDVRTRSDAGFERSLFQSEQDTENGIPEVQHSGFEPGILEPGYQSEPPPPEGWDPQAPPTPERQASSTRTDWELGPAAPGPEEARREEVRRRLPVSAEGRSPARRSIVLPVAITLLLGLFVGFLAGYLVFMRDGGAGSEAARPASAGPSGVTPPPGPAASTQAPPAGRSQPEAPPRASSAAPPGAASGAPRASEPERRAPARAAAAPSRAVPRGRLVVRSNPSGAQVYVNGRRRGATPLALRDLAPGTYAIRVSREGYTEASRRVTVSGSSVREVTVPLSRRAPARPTTFTGSLYVDSRPRGARVVVDGKEVGVTPLQLSDIRAGTHVVRLELTDHRTWTTSARVVAGEVVRVTGSLERMR